jgi:Zn-finger nucleic acid-binding protein
MESTPKQSMHCPNCGAGVASDAVRCIFCESVLTLSACPACFTAVFQGTRFCPSCGAAVERSEAESDKKRPCPRCEKALRSADIGGTRIQECDTCGGIWLDTASFQKICADREQQEKVMVHASADPVNVTASSTGERPGRFYVPCPECGEIMNRRNFVGCSGIVVDYCTRHGTWFDRRELQGIVRFIEDGGLRKARENELAAIKVEQERLKEMEIAQNRASMDLNEHDPFLRTGLGLDGIVAGAIGAIFRKLL